MHVSALCERVCSDLSDMLNQLTSEVAAVSAQLSADRRNRVVMSLDSVNRCCYSYHGEA